MIDLKTSRRDYFLHCAYWSQDENEEYINNNEIIHYKDPTGYFYAKELNTYQVSSEIISGIFMAESVSVTIETRDNVRDLKRNDIVVIDNKPYRVDSIQLSPIKKQRQFLRNEYSQVYTIILRG